MPRFKDYYTLVEGWKCDFRQKVFLGPWESHSIDYRLLSSHVRPAVLLPPSPLSFDHSLPFGKGIQFLNSQCRWLQLSLSLCLGFLFPDAADFPEPHIDRSLTPSANSSVPPTRKYFRGPRHKHIYLPLPWLRPEAAPFALHAYFCNAPWLGSSF